MYHSMTIIPYDEDIYNAQGKLNGINTWDNWHLIPKVRPHFAPPPVKTNYIEVPGANGSIDLTEMTPSYVNYGNRTGHNDFYVMTGWPHYGNWANRYSDIMDYLHGRRVKVVLETDPSYYYEGRLSVNNWSSDKDNSSITIDYNLDPYKYSTLSTTDDWLWDPFNFYDGIIRKKSDYTNIIIVTRDIGEGIESAKFVDIVTRSMPVIPTIKLRKTTIPNENPDPYIKVELYKNGVVNPIVSYTVRPNPSGTYKFPDLVVSGNVNRIGFFTPQNTIFVVTVDYRDGRL